MFNLNLVIMRGSDQELFVVITDKTTEEFADEFERDWEPGFEIIGQLHGDYFAEKCHKGFLEERFLNDTELWDYISSTIHLVGISVAEVILTEFVKVLSGVGFGKLEE